jgi:hypothetical protein
MEVPAIASPRGPKGQALQAVRQQAQFGARAGVVEPIDDVLNHSAVKPSRFQRLLRCVGNPVALPPGRAALSTKPAPTGSGTCTNTIGTVRLTCCKACTGWLPLARTTSASATARPRACEDHWHCLHPNGNRSARCPFRSSPTPAGPARIPHGGPVFPDRSRREAALPQAVRPRAVPRLLRLLFGRHFLPSPNMWRGAG